MKKYRVFNQESGFEMGVFEGSSAEEAIQSCHFQATGLCGSSLELYLEEVGGNGLEAEEIACTA